MASKRARRPASALWLTPDTVLADFVAPDIGLGAPDEAVNDDEQDRELLHPGMGELAPPVPNQEIRAMDKPPAQSVGPSATLRYDVHMEPCPGKRELRKFLRNALSSEEALAYQEHIAGCGGCHAALAQMGVDQAARLGSATLPAPAADDKSPAPIEPSMAATTPAEPVHPVRRGRGRGPARVAEYRLVASLGEGTTGEVFEAHDTLLDRRVAIKFLHARNLSRDAQERFVREARAIARLHHPNIMLVHRIAQHRRRWFIVSELVQGQSLDKLPKPVSPDLVGRIARDLARGLGAAHRRGVLHRDIKPANAMLADTGEVKLLDFSLAKLLGAAEERGTGVPPFQVHEAGSSGESARALLLTPHGAAVGTLLYMSPEVMRGESATIRSDIYSLGVVLYELSSAIVPHQGSSIVELFDARQKAEPRPLAEFAALLPAAFCALVDRCLRREPAERPASCEELCHVLDGLVTPEHSAASAAVPEGNPYRGLLPFEAEHRGLFFGRGPEVREIVDRLRSGPVVLVSGSSGAGKSSLCRAGVLPVVVEGALGEGRHWRCVVLVPGRRPLAALGDALAPVLEKRAVDVMPLLQRPSAELGRALRRKLGDDSGLLLFIDQMEELLTQSDAVEAVLASEVLGYLVERIPGVRVLMTVRGDYLTKLLEATDLGDELLQGTYVLRAMAEEWLREAIEGPARARGVTFESAEMVSALVASTKQAEGGLPLLQFALAQLWEGRDASRQVIPAYALEEIGGVAGALAQHADGVMARLGAAQARAARRMLLRLVTLEGTRARRLESELLTGDPAEREGLEALVKGRMLVAREAAGGGVSYEVAHEALVTGWETLRTWLATDLDGRALRERLENAAAEWERLEGSREVLWSQAQLHEADVLAPDPAELLPRAVAFLGASRREAARRQRTRRGVIVGLLCLPLLLLMFGQQWRTALRERQRAEEISLERLGVRAENLAQVPGQGVQALVSSIQSVGPSLRRHQVPSTPAMLGLSAAAAAVRRSLPLSGHKGVVNSVAFSPDGRRVITAGEDATARLWSVQSGRLLCTLSGHSKALLSAMFSGDGTRIVTSSGDGTARLWNAHSCRLSAALIGHSARISIAAFSPDGSRIITASDDQTARLWNGQDGLLLGVLKEHTHPVSGASFSTDSSRVLTLDGTVRLWSANDGQLLAVLRDAGDGVHDASFSVNTERIVIARDAEISIWALSKSSQSLLMTLKSPSNDHSNDLVSIVRYSPDGRFIVSGHNGIGGLWNSQTGGLLSILGGHSLDVRWIAFSANGRNAVTISEDGGGIWRLEGGQLLMPLETNESLADVSLSPDGQHVLTGGDIGRVWNLHAGVQDVTLEGHIGGVLCATLSNNGRLAATAGNDHTARVWDLPSGKQLLLLSGHSDRVRDVAFSPDGDYLATCSRDMTARVYDLRTAQVLATLKGRGPVAGCTFSSDGSRLAARDGGYLKVWDWRKDRVTLDIKDQQNDMFDSTSIGSTNFPIMFSPDGRHILHGTQVSDAQTGQIVVKINEHIQEMAYSPDGMRIISAGNPPRIVDARSGQVLVTLVGHEGVVWHVAYSGDGTRVATSGQDLTTRIWDSQTGELIAALRLPAQANHIALSRDGLQFIVSIDDVAQVFPATTEAIFHKACNLLRYQPEFAQVQAECQGQLDPEPPL